MARLPPLNAIRVFEAAARHLSFTRAARELCVTQGAVSQQVKGLEEALGVRLFLRVDRGLRLTEEGRRSVVVVLGLIGAFAVAGLIEGFVTGSPLPTWARVGVGVAVWAAFGTYVVRLGRGAQSRPAALTSR